MKFNVDLFVPVAWTVVVEAESAEDAKNIIKGRVKELSESWDIYIDGFSTTVTHYRDIEIEDVRTVEAKDG